jgi:hypothetical protein
MMAPPASLKLYAMLLREPPRFHGCEVEQRPLILAKTMRPAQRGPHSRLVIEFGSQLDLPGTR